MKFNRFCVLASCLALGPLPPPPPISRNGSTSRALPTTPQLPSRAGLDSQRGARPPLPPDRPGSAAPPPPPPPSAAVRNGFQDPGDGEPSSHLFALRAQGVVAFGPNASKKVWDRDFVGSASLQFLTNSSVTWVSINTGKSEQNKYAIRRAELQSHQYSLQNNPLKNALKKGNCFNSNMNSNHSYTDALEVGIS